MFSAFERFCLLVKTGLPIFYACKRLLYSIPEDLVILEIRFESHSPFQRTIMLHTVPKYKKQFDGSTLRFTQIASIALMKLVPFRCNDRNTAINFEILCQPESRLEDLQIPQAARGLVTDGRKHHPES